MSFENRLEAAINKFTTKNCGELQIKNLSVNFIFKDGDKVVKTFVVMRTGNLTELDFDPVAVGAQIDRVEAFIGKDIEVPVEPQQEAVEVQPVKSLYKKLQKVQPSV